MIAIACVAIAVILLLNAIATLVYMGGAVALLVETKWCKRKDEE